MHKIVQKKIYITFVQNKAIEIAFSTIKEGKENQFLKDYFPNVLPLVIEYDGRFIAAFHNQTLSGDIDAQNIAFFEWPSVGSFSLIFADSRSQELLKIRNDALEYINEGNFYSVLKTTEVEFSSSKIYMLIGTELASTDFDKLITDFHGSVIALLVRRDKFLGKSSSTKLYILEWESYDQPDKFVNEISYVTDSFFLL